MMNTAQRYLRTTRAMGLAVLLICAYAGTPQTVAAQQLIFSSGGGPLSLTVNSAVAGSEPTDATDNSNEIYWDADFGVTTKMTVTTSCPTQAFQLHILLTVTSWASGTSGNPQAEVQLTDGMLDADLLTDILSTSPERMGYATLTYRAAATAAQGNSTDHGDDYHTVTFTILAQ